jgi:predicted  nucleic acid-binding Zn-ribbon protein
MWEKIWDLVTKTVTLAKQTDQNTTDIKELQREMREMHSWLERPAYEVQKTRDDDRHEREKLALRLENELLKFERRLPTSKTTEE